MECENHENEEEEEGGEEEQRNWSELPPDILIFVFLKLGTRDVFFRAQSVCSSWRKASFEPVLWRSVDLRHSWRIWECDQELAQMEEMVRHIVDRSKGQLMEFSIREFATDELLIYIAERFNHLKCLRLNSCYEVTEDGFLDSIAKLPQLEELDISYCSLSCEHVLETIGLTCTQLKCLQINAPGFRHHHIVCDDEAVAIGRTMPELHRLEISGNKLSDEGLRAILDGCPLLNSLDMSECFSLALEASLRKRCVEKIKDLKLPNQYDHDDDDCDSDGSFSFENGYEDEYLEGFSDIDTVSDDDYYEFSDGGDWGYAYSFFPDD